MTTFKSEFFRSRVAAIAAAVLLLLSAPARSETADDFLHSLINQKLILRYLGDQDEVRLKKNQVHKLSGPCDIAVIVTAVKWERGTVRFDLQDIGQPSVSGPQTGPRGSCKSVSESTTLKISGFAADEQPDSLRAVIGEILLTPEQYMGAHGVSFDLAPGPEDEPTIKAQPPVRPARALLSVEPTFSEEARQAKYQGTLHVSLVVGTDGRPHRVRVIRPLGKGLDEMALKVLPMWRFEPARQQDKPVATEVTIEISFNLY